MGTRIAPICCTARSSISHSGRFLQRTATLSRPSTVISLGPMPRLNKPALNLSAVSATFLVLYVFHCPLSFPESITSSGSLSKCQARQSNNLLGSVMVQLLKGQQILLTSYKQLLK